MPLLSPIKRYLIVQLDYDKRIRRALLRLATIVRVIAKGKIYSPYNQLRQLLYVQHNFLTVEIEPIIRSGVLASRLAAFTYVQHVLRGAFDPRLADFLDKHYSSLLTSPSIYMGNTWARIHKANSSVFLAPPSIISLSQRLHDSLNPTIPGGASWPVINFTRAKMSEEFREEQIKLADPLWTKSMKWQLSDDHPEKDECNVLASSDHYDLGKGIYPLKLIPPRPHYGCLCYITYLINKDLF